VLKEAQSINKSLSALGGVIGALTTGAAHVPYRDHALTMLMSDSIGGNAKTLMFVNCSPADYNNMESNSSLAFAARCKDITNPVNVPQVYRDKIGRLRSQFRLCHSLQLACLYNCKSRCRGVEHNNRVK